MLGDRWIPWMDGLPRLLSTFTIMLYVGESIYPKVQLFFSHCNLTNQMHVSIINNVPLELLFRNTALGKLECGSQHLPEMLRHQNCSFDRGSLLGLIFQVFLRQVGQPPPSLECLPDIHSAAVGKLFGLCPWQFINNCLMYYR